jgi:uncharacterized membrane protein YozB (DUF420 family)
MPSGYDIILVLKIAVSAVTLVLLAALWALARGNLRLHGRINLVFFVLTMTAVLIFEGLIRFGPSIEPGWSVTEGWSDHELWALRVHLCFVIPLMVVLPAMLFTGLRRWRRWHLTLAGVFSVLWLGMLVTGIGFLPHRP